MGMTAERVQACHFFQFFCNQFTLIGSKPLDILTTKQNESGMFFQQLAKPRQQKGFQATFTGTLFLMAGLIAIAQEPVTKEQTNDKLAKVVKLGEAIVENTTTHPMSKEYVGNALNCTSCHLNNGRHEKAGTFLGTATAYPAWSPREDRVITLEDRVLNCFMRSCNGTRPPLGSEVSVAVTAYITSLSQGQPLRMNSNRPVGPGAIKLLAVKPDQADIKRGASLYTSRCAECHQKDGQGDNDNPPVWGDRSYNDGAGLSSVENLAAWLKVAMPPDATDLTDEQALDIAAYVNSHKRPHFELSEHLPAKERLGEYNASKEK
jgi:thiosulfate dehydrogenase